jgi:L-serine kinase (ATP) / ParB family transcriptional regulator, heme-responsive regulator
MKAVLVHEWYDEQRTPRLTERIINSDLFRNPPIVTPTQDNTNRYIVLDGANRTSALKALNCPDMLVQVVQAGDPGLKLRTWNHVLSGIDPGKLMDRLRIIPDLDLASSEEEIELPDRPQVGIALIQTIDGKVWGLSATGRTTDRQIAMLNTVVSIYKQAARLDRTTYSEIKELRPLYPDLSALVIFPKFSVPDLVSLASRGCLLPAGITRTTISPRALNVNLPLGILMSDEPLSDKQAYLQKMIGERYAGNKIVFYPEATMIFDE